jgi:hypothetical protein
MTARGFASVVGVPLNVGTGPSGVAVTPCVGLAMVVGADGRGVTVTGSLFAPAGVRTVSIASTPLPVAPHGTAEPLVEAWVWRTSTPTSGSR